MLSEAQRRIRRNGLGASEIAAVLGLSRYDGPADIYLEKVVGRPFTQNRYTYWGSLLEDDIAQWYTDFILQGRCTRLLESHELPSTDRYEQVTADGRPTGTLRHREFPYLLCTPDRVFSDFSRILEIKTAAEKYGRRNTKAQEWSCAGEPKKVPIGYAVQTTYQMWFLGIHAADLAVLIGKDDPRHYDIRYDAAWIGRALPELARFWARVEARDPNPAWESIRYENAAAWRDIRERRQ